MIAPEYVDLESGEKSRLTVEVSHLFMGFTESLPVAKCSALSCGHPDTLGNTLEA